MKSEGYWAIHGLFRELAEYLEADIEDTEYDELDIKPVSIYSSKEEHREAIRLLSKALEEDESIDIEYLETWEEDAELSDYAGRHGRSGENPIGK